MRDFDFVMIIINQRGQARLPDRELLILEF